MKIDNNPFAKGFRDTGAGKREKKWVSLSKFTNWHYKADWYDERVFFKTWRHKTGWFFFIRILIAIHPICIYIELRVGSWGSFAPRTLLRRTHPFVFNIASLWAYVRFPSGPLLPPMKPISISLSAGWKFKWILMMLWLVCIESVWYNALYILFNADTSLFFFFFLLHLSNYCLVYLRKKKNINELLTCIIKQK